MARAGRWSHLKTRPQLRHLCEQTTAKSSIRPSKLHHWVTAGPLDQESPGSSPGEQLEAPSQLEPGWRFFLAQDLLHTCGSRVFRFRPIHRGTVRSIRQGYDEVVGKLRGIRESAVVEVLRLVSHLMVVGRQW